MFIVLMIQTTSTQEMAETWNPDTLYSTVSDTFYQFISTYGK